MNDKRFCFNYFYITDVAINDKTLYIKQNSLSDVVTAKIILIG